MACKISCNYKFFITGLMGICDRVLTKSLWAHSCQRHMTMNSYIWSTKWFTYRNKQSTANAVGNEDKF
ncbi:hypothetical protein EPI10_024315 [Gossypium australe]|uniref:Uncharacterized protein n=1 Tax=Gossypium australe TaxID=47621 RepID=A0A5B6VXG1_9ROSI|nr:hypothetical protein EPI10_024315 [Gossypium australe]